jgi:hypothetical protein
VKNEAFNNLNFIESLLSDIEDLFEEQKNTTKDNGIYAKILQIEDKIRDILRKHYLC